MQSGMGKGKKKRGERRKEDTPDTTVNADDAETEQNYKDDGQPPEQAQVASGGGGGGEAEGLSRKQKRLLKLQKKKERETTVAEKEDVDEDDRKTSSGFAGLQDDDDDDEDVEGAGDSKLGFAPIEDEDEDEDGDDDRKVASGFAALNLSDSDEEDEDENDSKKKKKKKKEKKVKFVEEQDDDDDVTLGRENADRAAEEEVEEEEDSGDDKKKKKQKEKKKKKPSNKERRKFRAENEAEIREQQLKELATKETDFAVSATANTMSKEQWENTVDIDIPQFTISAYGKTLFKNATLKIAAGRRYGLVGPNGHGKSTLLRQVANGELPIPPKIDVLYVEQEVKADVTPAVEMVLRADKKRTALLKREDEIMALLDSDEISDEDSQRLQEELEAVTAELRATGSASAEARALSLLNGLGFTPEMQRAPTKTFSGGWRMRVSIARALFIEPTLLLLDEPTNHLDMNAVIWLDDYLQRWKKTLLVVSHDQDFLDSVCTDIIHVDQQQLFYYRGNYETFKALYEKQKEKMKKAWEKQEKELHALKKAGKSSKKAKEESVKKRSRETGGARKGGKKDGKNPEEGSSSAALADKQLLQRPKDYEVFFEFPQPTELQPPYIQVNNVSFNYPGGPVLFKNLEFGIDMQSRITVVGPNGVGKSTLLKLITQEVEPTEGEVLINRHLRIARYHQHFVDVLPMDKSPVEYLQETFSETSYQLVRNRLGKFGLSGNAHTIKMVNLSGGQKSRVLFTSLSFQNPHILILDEPTNNLDTESIDALADAINDFEGGVILVSHDARLVLSTEMVLWVVENQSVAEQVGGYEAYRDEILEDLRKKDEEEKKRQEERQAAKEAERKAKLEALAQKRKAKQQQHHTKTAAAPPTPVSE